MRAKVSGDLFEFELRGAECYVKMAAHVDIAD
jgi:hypothetical protein